MKTRVCLIYFVHDCLWKHAFASNSPRSPSNLIFWTILLTMRFFKQFQFKIRATKLQKVLNVVLLDKCFTNLFTEVQIWYRKSFRFAPGHFFRKVKFVTIWAVNKNKKQKKISQAIMDIIFQDFFVSPQVKQSVIVSNKHSIYKLSYKLWNDLRLRN